LRRTAARKVEHPIEHELRSVDGAGDQHQSIAHDLTDALIEPIEPFWPDSVSAEYSQRRGRASLESRVA
jgi:hypothetical protein